MTYKINGLASRVAPVANIPPLLFPLRPALWRRFLLYFTTRAAMNREFAQAYKVALDLYYEAEANRQRYFDLKRNANVDVEELAIKNDNLETALLRAEDEKARWRKAHDLMFKDWQNLLDKLTKDAEGKLSWKEDPE